MKPNQFRIKILRGSSQNFFDTLKNHPKRLLSPNVMLLSDTNQLVYRNPALESGWGFIDGELVDPDHENDFEVGEITLGPHVRVRCDEGVYMFVGCQIKMETSTHGVPSAFWLDFHFPQPTQYNGEK